MYVVCGIFLQDWSPYHHTLMYSHGTWTQWSLGRVTHVTSTDMRSKVIYGSMTFGLTFWKKKVTESTHTLMYFHETWTQWSSSRDTHVTSTDLGVKGALGVYDLWLKVLKKKDHCIHILWCIFMGVEHNDPWVVSHMWPHQTWVKGHLGVNDLWFKFWYGVKSDITILQKYKIVKSGETRGSRTALFGKCVLEAPTIHLMYMYNERKCTMYCWTVHLILSCTWWASEYFFPQ